MTKTAKPEIILHINAGRYCLQCFEISGEFPLPEKSWSIQEYKRPSDASKTLKTLYIPNINNYNGFRYLTTSIVYDFDLDGSIWLEVGRKRINTDNSSLEALRKSLLMTISNVETEYALNPLE